MPAPDAAIQHYRAQQQLAARTVAAARQVWARLRADDFDGSWVRVGPRLRAVLTVAQARAVADSAGYVPAVLAGQGIDVAALETDASALVGVASSGGDLASLLYGVVIQAKQFVADGMAGPLALRQTTGLLDGVMMTQVADAGRVATGLETIARPKVGYVRMLVAPSCSRCVVLAGKFYGPLAGFARHPRCNCIHVPTLENLAGDIRTDPDAYFGSLTPQQQDATFTRAGAQAIRDGADSARVVNARKGVYTASAHGRTVTATHSRTRGTRGLRLMPEQIYKDAGSRADALRLLRLHGYIR